MKKIFAIVLFASLTLNAICQKTVDLDDNAISKFALSINPLGFLQFGPSIVGELGLNENIALNAHIRFPSLGVLSYVIRADGNEINQLKGMAFGAGLNYFFGERKSKPYMGMWLGFEKTTGLYDEGTSYEWSEKDNVFIFFFNGGYRFRFDGGFFVNTGAFLGVANSNWDWSYTDPNYGTGNSGKTLAPFGMLEVALGLEF